MGALSQSLRHSRSTRPNEQTSHGCSCPRMLNHASSGISVCIFRPDIHVVASDDHCKYIFNGLNMDNLPSHVIEAIFTRLHVLHLLPIMACSRRLYGIGRNMPIWTRLRVMRGLPCPKRHDSTDFDVVQRFLQISCIVCHKISGRGDRVCKQCSKYDREYILYRLTKKAYASQMECHAMTLQILKNSHEALGELTARLHTAEATLSGMSKAARWKSLVVE